jgi:hypothetical protein
VVGVSCTVYYRRALTKNLKGFIFAGLFPLLSAITLFILGGYLIWTDWNASSAFAFDATNGKFLVVVPLLGILSGVLALIYSYLRRHPKYMSMPAESAPSNALG